MNIIEPNNPHGVIDSVVVTINCVVCNGINQKFDRGVKKYKINPTYAASTADTYDIAIVDTLANKLSPKIGSLSGNPYVITAFDGYPIDMNSFVNGRFKFLGLILNDRTNNIMYGYPNDNGLSAQQVAVVKSGAINVKRRSGSFVVGDIVIWEYPPYNESPGVSDNKPYAIALNPNYMCNLYKKILRYISRATSDPGFYTKLESSDNIRMLKDDMSSNVDYLLMSNLKKIIMTIIDIGLIVLIKRNLLNLNVGSESKRKALNENYIKLTLKHSDLSIQANYGALDDVFSDYKTEIQALEEINNFEPHILYTSPTEPNSVSDIVENSIHDAVFVNISMSEHKKGHRQFIEILDLLGHSDVNKEIVKDNLVLKDIFSIIGGNEDLLSEYMPSPKKKLSLNLAPNIVFSSEEIFKDLCNNIPNYFEEFYSIVNNALKNRIIGTALANIGDNDTNKYLKVQLNQ